MERSCRLPEQAEVLRIDLNRLPPKRARQLFRYDAGERTDLLHRALLARQRGDLAVLDAARHDPFERLEVVGDVDGEAVCGHSTADVDADRTDLALLARPDAGQALARRRLDAMAAERGDERVLQDADVAVDVVAQSPQA